MTFDYENSENNDDEITGTDEPETNRNTEMNENTEMGGDAEIDEELEPVGNTESMEYVPAPYTGCRVLPGAPVFMTEEKKEDKKRGKNRKISRVVAAALICTLLGGLGGGAVTGYYLTNSSGGTVITQNSSSASAAALSSTADSSESAMTPAEIYATYSKAVVGISTESTTMNVFGQVSSTASSGTGYIISSDGYIVTNQHVIDGAEKITVTLIDNTQYTATLVGSDDESDIAVLKIDAKNLTTVSLGDSDDLVVGETVVAIGNPLGELTYTLTVGYVSALDRAIAMDDGTTLDMLQTDAAINAGNSGGPLFDLSGNVIGMVTAKYSSDSIEGLGFAIPINNVTEIVKQLIDYGYVKGRPELGVTVQDISESTARFYNLTVGVYVSAVDSGSAADKAGIQKGDIITAVGDTSVETTTALKSALSEYAAGDTVKLTVTRSGKSVTVSVTLDEQSQDSGSTTSASALTGQSTQDSI